MAALSETNSSRPDYEAPAQDRTLAELEQAFLASTDKQVQLDTAAEIAGHHDEAAVQTLARLFRRTQHPDVKEGVLAAIGDIDPATAPTARITLLQGALFGQPRNVRLAALDALAHFDDPRAAAALQRAAREDPDKLIREAAAAFAGVVENEAR